MIVHLIEQRDIDNIVTMCKQLAVLAPRDDLTHWQRQALEYLPTQIMEALEIRWAEGPEFDWSHLVDDERLEQQLSYGCYRRRAFRWPDE